jgi:hypothetical protein
LLEVDAQLARHDGVLSPVLRRKLSDRRATAEPVGSSAEHAICAERSLWALERDMDEALGLAAELRATVNPVLPSLAVVARWAAMTVASCALLVLLVGQLGLGDFVLQAYGVKVLRANATMPCERVAFEAQRSAGVGPTPKHAQWVDPQSR